MFGYALQQHQLRTEPGVSRNFDDEDESGLAPPSVYEQMAPIVTRKLGESDTYVLQSLQRYSRL